MGLLRAIGESGVLERREALVALVAALLMICAGLTWRFGAYGLVGSGVLIIGAVALLPAKDGRR